MNTSTDLLHRPSAPPERGRYRPRAARRLLTGGAGALVCAALTIGSVGHAAATPNKSRPTREAAEVGITAVGGGYAGWAAKRQQQLHPDSATTRSIAPDGGQSSGPQGTQRSAPGSPSGVAPRATASTVPGLDVSSYQGTVNWSSWWSKGKRFAYVKATEGTSYTSPTFSSQYAGSYKAGMIRGAYHFGRPDGAAGYLQARWFVKHGGGWSADGKTLPGALDIEDNYAGSRCYGNTDAQNVAWVKSFVTEYKKLTGRDAVIYTNGPFWKDCLGNSTAFKAGNPLWLAYWSSTAPKTFPGGYTYYTFWQYSGTGTDLDRFSAGLTQLKKLATG